MERRLIKDWDLTNPEKGYNSSEGGEVGFFGGRKKWSDEQKEKHGVVMKERWDDYIFAKKIIIKKLRNKGICIPAYLDNTSLEDDWLDYNPLNPNYCGEAICKRVFAAKAELFLRKNNGY